MRVYHCLYIITQNRQNTKNGCAPKQKIAKLKVRMRTFCFHFPKQNSEIDLPYEDLLRRSPLW